MNQIDKFEARLAEFNASVQAEIAALKAQQQPAPWQPWKPEVGEVYYCLNADGDIVECDWYGNSCNNARYEMGNVFRTKEEAIRKRDKERVMHKLRVLANGFVPDWSSNFQQKWEIYYNYETEKLSEAWHTSCRDASTRDVYFATQEDAKNARLTLGDELLVLFDIVKKEG